MSEPTQITLTLHGDAVVAPALRAVEQSVDVVSFCMQSLEKTDLSKPPEFESSRFQMKFTGTNVSAEERKTRYMNWVLSKGFQDLARGIRGMLEEAYFYISMMDFLIKGSAQKTTWGSLQEKIQEYRKQAGAANFPDLMEAVNKGLTSPLHFEKEFLSLQQVRNCLEHRNGVVSERDADKDTRSLKLSLPHLRIYGEKDGKQIELGKGSFVEKDTMILFKNEIQVREFKLGERIVFKAEEFHDIGFGCWAFAQDLGSKLPQIETAAKT
jgi:hypothetical protein